MKGGERVDWAEGIGSAKAKDSRELEDSLWPVVQVPKTWAFAPKMLNTA